MQKTRKIFLWLLVINSFALYGDNKYCSNLNFGNGDFTNWAGYTWYHSTISSVTSTTPKPDFSLQTIMKDTTAYDANTNYQLRKVPSGYKYSARLGDETANTQAASLRYTITVDSMNAFLTYKFAVVFLNPTSGHTRVEEPRFMVTLFDEKGDTIRDCSNYDVYASDAELSNSFKTFTLTSGYYSGQPVLWRDWTTVGANLLPYYGKTVTIEFMASDCTHKGHFGYAYLVADCQPLNITVQYCDADSRATLVAPNGFVSYVWKDASGAELAKTRQITIDSPTEGAVYSCTMNSATGCTVTLSSVIARYSPKANFGAKMLDCLSNTVQFTDSSSYSRGHLEYNWDFGDGFTSNDVNPSHMFSASGLHQVSLTVTNPPSTCSQTLTKTIESFYPPSVLIKGDSTYCPGGTAWLKGDGAASYEWGKLGDTSFHSEADSIEVAAPGGKYWMLGYSRLKECVSDTIFRTIIEEPYWPFTSTPDTIFCTGDSVKISAYGGVSYVWNTGETTSSIVVKTPGNYNVIGTNPRGCSKTLSLSVTQVARPDPFFSFEPASINIKHNQVTCSVTPVPGTVYYWDFGDSTKTETGATATHAYRHIEVTKDGYSITLTAVNSSGCDSVSVAFVKIIPFIPNVFTPNGDGVNDVFLSDPSYSIAIYDRNGTEIFNGKGGWDGKYKGKAADEDTYFYYVKYTNEVTKTEQHLKGYVTLKR